MGKKESYLSEIDRRERKQEALQQKKIQSHKCHSCYRYGRWTGTKFTCMLPRCFKDVNQNG